MSSPSIECVYVTEDCVREWKCGNPALKVSEPVPMLRFLYELCWTMVRGELPLQKCKVALDSVIFSDKASNEKIASNFADIVTQMAQDHTVSGDYRTRLIKLARWLVESEMVPVRLLQERCEEEFLGEAELIKIKAQELKGKEKQSSELLDFMETQYEESEMNDSSSSSSEDEEEEEEIEKELVDVTFEELQKARSNGAHAFFQKPGEDKKLKRANKNRPMEASSKKPVSAFREVIQAPKKVVRDPRFESLCGNLDTEGFRKRYNFLFENDLLAERQALKKDLKKYKNPKRINEIEERIAWIDKQLKSGSAKRIDAEILAKHKKKEREAAKQGKRPFYLKKSDIRKQRLIEKYNKLKSSGKLEAFLEKRRRRNAAKDHRYMPYRSSGDLE